MPQTVYMARHWRRDHGFTIPDPLLTKQHGIPNACNRCHPDKSVDWSIEYVEKWYGSRMERPTRTRAQVIAQARKGDDQAVGALLTMARSETNALWRASATILLRRWCQQTNVTRALVEQTKDAAPLVRAMAVRGLDLIVPRQEPAVQSALSRLLGDPARLVRVDAAWALRTTVNTNSTAFADLVRYLRHSADQPGGALQVAVFYLDRGDADTALSYLRKSIVWDPNSAPLHHALAMALNLQGKMDEVVPALQEACRLAPRDPEYRYKLGLALNEIGKLPEATAALEETVKLDPQFSQAWYNLGLAYAAANQPERALEVLLRAEAIDSMSARIPYARATVLARLGRVQEARAAARRALEVQPGSPDATALLRQLEGEQ
jgi:Flp pilus assembly protein TadD